MSEYDDEFTEEPGDELLDDDERLLAFGDDELEDDEELDLDDE